MSGTVGAGFRAFASAAKAGLIILAQSLRFEYVGRGVSFSAVVAGPVGEKGMFFRAERDGLVARPKALKPAKVGDFVAAVLGAIGDDSPLVVVPPRLNRLMMLFRALAPATFERVSVEKIAIHEMFKAQALDHERHRCEAALGQRRRNPLDHPPNAQ
jgi:NAD(P)-dependent dehydrogenase (short-subunit alcohol dehydrogenase family)